MATPAAASPAAASGDPLLPSACRVRQSLRETGDTFTLVLDPPGGGLPFEPGQFNMLYLPGAGEAPISISGDPATPELLVHTIRAVGGVTRGLQRLAAGDCVGVRGPYGSGWPVGLAQGHDVVIVAGGIGLAPLRPAVRHVLLHRGQYGRLVLLYGARTPRDILYARELREWRGRFDFDVEVTVDRATPEWQGSVGVVTRLIERAPFDPSAAVAFLCGPEIMMRFAIETLQRRGLGDDSLFASLERHMQCGFGLCGHCQFGPFFVCKDGPVFRYDQIASRFGEAEV